MKTKCTRILVSGGAGFIGSHLCAQLLRDGCQVLCLDNLYTGSLENISTFMNMDSFEFLHMDVMDKRTLEMLNGYHIDAIYHLACPASPIHYQKNPIYTIRVSFEGTLNMLELAKHNGCPILFSSTSEVYGNPKVNPQQEDYLGNVSCIGPRSCYDEGKRCAESLCMDYHRQYAVDVKIIRIFNTYGPRMAVNDGRVVSNFVVQALQGKDITVNGDGSQTRSFMYINDLIEGMLRVMKCDYRFLINLGNPEEITVLELAYKVVKLTNSKSQIKFHSLPQDDPYRRCPDIALATKYLDGWKPKVSLEEGLRKMIDYYKKHLHI